MRAALAVHQTSEDPVKTLHRIVQMVHASADAGGDAIDRFPILKSRHTIV